METVYNFDFQVRVWGYAVTTSYSHRGATRGGQLASMAEGVPMAEWWD